MAAAKEPQDTTAGQPEQTEGNLVRRIVAAQDLGADALSAVRRHGVHIGLALLTPDRIYRAAKHGQIDLTGRDIIEAVLIPALGAVDENVHVVRHFSKPKSA